MNPAKIKVVEVKDGMVEIDAFKTMILFCNSAFKNINLTGDLALPVLYIGILLCNSKCNCKIVMGSMYYNYNGT